MDEKKPKEKKKIHLFAPYRQCEAAVHATALASFLLRKLKDIRVWDFQYITCDTVSGYCSPFVDPHVYRVVSPSDFASHLHNVRAVYWCSSYWDYLKKSSTRRRKNFLFGDFTQWDKSQMVKTRA